MKLTHAFAAILFAGAAVPAAADTVHVSSFASPAGYKTGKIHNDAGIGPGGTTKNLDVEVTNFILHVDSPSSYNIITYCIDLADYLSPPDNYEVGTAGLIPAVAAKQTALLSLLTHTLAIPGNPSLAQSNTAVAAGVQLAIWEILNETTTPTWNILDGSFWAYNNSGSLGDIASSTSAMGLAKDYLTKVSAGGLWASPVPSYELRVLSGATNDPAAQDQIFIIAVPEPATWGMMIGGFALVGGSLRAARKRKLRAFA